VGARVGSKEREAIVFSERIQKRCTDIPRKIASLQAISAKGRQLVRVFRSEDLPEPARKNCSIPDKGFKGILAYQSRLLCSGGTWEEAQSSHSGVPLFHVQFADWVHKITASTDLISIEGRQVPRRALFDLKMEQVSSERPNKTHRQYLRAYDSKARQHESCG